MYCENCGALIPDSAKFCPECGNAQSPGLKAEPETLHCPYCGTELEPDSVFCENCGKKLNVRDVRSDQTPSISEQPQSYAVPPVPPEQEKTHVPSAPSVPPVPPAPSTASERTHVTAIPAPPSAAVRETAPEKKKKRSGCCSAVLIVLILLILLCLAACYYFWKVYEGDNQIKNLISGFMPTAEMILTKAPEAISRCGIGSDKSTGDRLRAHHETDRYCRSCISADSPIRPFDSTHCHDFCFFMGFSPVCSDRYAGHIDLDPQYADFAACEERV